MNPIRIAFFDIDGTLIDMEKKQITPTTLEMLRRLQSKGIRICLATSSRLAANGSDKDLADYFAIATDHCGHVAEEGIYHYCVEHGLI